MKCAAEHPGLDLKCDKDDDHVGVTAHTATDEDGNPHAWVLPSDAARLDEPEG
jgi:hypothetical protein